MGVDCKINLPLHVRGEHVLSVIGKLVDMEYKRKAFTSHDVKHFDPNEIASTRNPCMISFPDSLSLESDKRTYYMAHLQFEDKAGSHYQWYFFNETEYEDRKSLNPSSYALSALIGKKLIDFFGGSVIYSDYTDDISHSCDNPIFPQKKPEESSNDRYYQFINLLEKVEPIKSYELKEIGEIVSFSERDQKLYDYLVKYEAFKELDQKIIEKDNNTISRKNKI